MKLRIEKDKESAVFFVAICSLLHTLDTFIFMFFIFIWKFYVNYYIVLRILGFLSFLSELLGKITFANSLCPKYGLNLHDIVLQVSEGTCQG